MFRLAAPSYKLYCEDSKTMDIAGAKSRGLIYGKY
jgi:hypothetical protein